MRTVSSAVCVRRLTHDLIWRKTDWQISLTIPRFYPEQSVNMVHPTTPTHPPWQSEERICTTTNAIVQLNFPLSTQHNNYAKPPLLVEVRNVSTFKAICRRHLRPCGQPDRGGRQALRAGLLRHPRGAARVGGAVRRPGVPAGRSVSLLFTVRF